MPACLFLQTSRAAVLRSEEHTSELQSRLHLVCRLLLEKKKTKYVHAARGFERTTSTILTTVTQTILCSRSVLIFYLRTREGGRALWRLSVSRLSRAPA